MTSNKWWANVFDEKYIKTYVDLNSEENTDKQVSFLNDSLNFDNNSKILDLACGFGRHAIPLAEQGHDVTGLDYSQDFINRAKEKNSPANFVQGDMRKLPFEDVTFDYVINMFTSFGYFKKEEDHLKTLTEVRRALKPKGEFLLDLRNYERVLKSTIKHGKYNEEEKIFISTFQQDLSNGISITRTRKLDPLTNKTKMRVEWKEEGEKKEYEGIVKNFTLSEIRYLLKQAGFKIKNIYGNYKGEKFNPQSNRMIIISKK